MKVEMIEGLQAKNNFDSAVGKVLSISHNELKRREEEWKKQRKRKKRAKG